VKAFLAKLWKGILIFLAGVGTAVLAFFALAGQDDPAAPVDVAEVKRKKREEILAADPGVLVDGLEPDTRAGIAAAKRDAIDSVLADPGGVAAPVHGTPVQGGAPASPGRSNARDRPVRPC
jgi:hypothetical protein